MRYVLWGGWFLAIYGIYEWLYFLIFHQPGDFIANRTYGEFEHTGSWSQSIELGPLTLLRIKSTFGEPSRLSAAVIPYLFLALEYKRKWLFRRNFLLSGFLHLHLGICGIRFCPAFL